MTTATITLEDRPALAPARLPVPTGLPIQDDLLAEFGVRAGGSRPAPQFRTRDQLTRKQLRLLALAHDAMEFAKEPSIDAVLRSAWQFWGRFAVYNGLLIICQRPSATHVETAEVWRNRYGMVPRPSEQPILVLHLGGPFNFVFDASQVELGPEPGTHAYEPSRPFARQTYSAAPQLLATMIATVKAHGVRVSEHGLGEARGGHIKVAATGAVQDVVVSRRPLTTGQVPVSFEVSLNATLSPTEQLGVLTHELGHLYCGHLGPDPALARSGEGQWLERDGLSHEQCEAEAEYVSQIVMGFLAPEAVLVEAEEPVELPDHASAVAAALAVELVLETVQTAMSRVR